MCGRFSLDPRIAEIRAILEEIDREQGDVPLKTGEIFPTDVVPVLRAQQGHVQTRAMSWGFPRWDGKGVVFNARAETALDKPLFRRALRDHPVVVPTTGFYEWKAVPGRRKKEKYLFRQTSTDIVYLAGFAKALPGDGIRADGISECFTILTTDANPFMMDYHDRMPILLLSDEREVWLSGEKLTYFLEREPFGLEAVQV